MTRISLFLVPALLFTLGSCGKEADATAETPKTTEKAATLEGETGCLGDCKEGEGAAKPTAAVVDVESLIKKADPKGVYGKGVTLTEFTKISDILAKPEEFKDKRVLVKGEAVKVCEKRGCFVELKSDQPFQSIRVKVEDGVIVFPMSCLGTEVAAEGIVQKLEFPVEKHREILAARAKAKGETFDPESVTQPLVVWQIEGLGAKIDG